MHRLLEAVQRIDQKLSGVIEGVNQHLGILFKNEREIGNMVYTNSVRVAVMRELLLQKLGIDDVAFDDLVNQELSRRAAEQKELEAAQLENAKNKAVEEAARETDSSTKAFGGDLETKEFGGDFGEEGALDAGVESEEPDQGRADLDRE